MISRTIKNEVRSLMRTVSTQNNNNSSSEDNDEKTNKESNSNNSNTSYSNNNNTNSAVTEPNLEESVTRYLRSALGYDRKSYWENEGLKAFQKRYNLIIAASNGISSSRGGVSLLEQILEVDVLLVIEKLHYWFSGRKAVGENSSTRQLVELMLGPVVRSFSDQEFLEGLTCSELSHIPARYRALYFGSRGIDFNQKSVEVLEKATGNY